MRSLAVVQALKPARIYPGHGPVVSDPETHVQMYIDNRNNREKQIVTALASGPTQQLFTAMDLVRIIYTVNYCVVNRWFKVVLGAKLEKMKYHVNAYLSMTFATGHELRSTYRQQHAEV